MDVEEGLEDDEGGGWRTEEEGCTLRLLHHIDQLTLRGTLRPASGNLQGHL